MFIFRINIGVTLEFRWPKFGKITFYVARRLGLIENELNKGCKILEKNTRQLRLRHGPFQDSKLQLRFQNSMLLTPTALFLFYTLFEKNKSDYRQRFSYLFLTLFFIIPYFTKSMEWCVMTLIFIIKIKFSSWYVLHLELYNEGSMTMKILRKFNLEWNIHNGDADRSRFHIVAPIYTLVVRGIIKRCTQTDIFLESV